MAFRDFHTQIILRVSLLVGTLAMLLYCLLETALYATSFTLALIAAYQVWSLVRFVDRTNLSLARFFESVRYSDFLQTNAVGQLGGSFSDLANAMSQVTSAFHAARAEKEENYRYLQTVIQHVGVGLMAYTDSGEVELLNPAAKRLLHTPQLRQIADVERVSPELALTLSSIEPGQRALIPLQTDYDSVQLAIHATKIRLGAKLLTLVSLQNISTELAEQEMVAWQNLIRVLTHEIMNSMTPIASLAGSAQEVVRTRLSAESGSTNDNRETADDLSEALQTIEKRSQGLIHFVESYRDLTRIPQPQLKSVAVEAMVGRVEKLMESSLSSCEITRSLAVQPDDLTVACDSDLIEQVLINLISNALHALQNVDQPELEIAAGLNRDGHVTIEVSDNGPGITPGAIDKIFIPFFTTRKGGTGIGLAISRQIMRLHGGHITVRSEPDVRTVFTLTF